MLDRESSFADDDVIELLRERFVPVAVDVWYEQRREDPAGEFFRKVVFQREGTSPDKTTQGFYVFGPDGKLLRGWNHRDPSRLRGHLREALDDHRPAVAPAPAAALDGNDDPRFARALPEGGLVVEVHSRIVDAAWPSERGDEYEEIRRRATGFDHLWIEKKEIEALVRGEFPKSLATRIARFHCIDNTRGEPPMWEKGEIRKLELGFLSLGGARQGPGPGEISGSLELLSAKGDRGFEARAFGRIERDAKSGAITRFDLVLRGEYFGHGEFTPGAPPGKFTLAIAFTIADGDRGSASATVPPQGARWLDDYLGRV